MKTTVWISCNLCKNRFAVAREDSELHPVTPSVCPACRQADRPKVIALVIAAVALPVIIALTIRFLHAY